MCQLYMQACMPSHFSHGHLFLTLWAITCQAPLSMGFSRQEYWSGLPCLPPGNLPDPGNESAALVSPALAGGFFTARATWETLPMYSPYTIRTEAHFPLVAHRVKNPPAMWGTQVGSLGWEDPLEKGTGTHSSILAWRISMDRGAWRATVHGVAKSQT